MCGLTANNGDNADADAEVSKEVSSNSNLMLGCWGSNQ